MEDHARSLGTTRKLPSAKVADKDKLIRDSLQKNGPQTMKDLGECVGIPPSTLYVRVNGLVAKGQVEHTGHRVALKETLEERVRAFFVSAGFLPTLEETAIHVGMQPDDPDVKKTYYLAASEWKPPQEPALC